MVSTQYHFDVLTDYCRSGNFRVKKLSYDKFSCKKNFVGTTPYRISVNSALIFVRLIFVADYENIFTSKISRFMVYHNNIIT